MANSSTTENDRFVIRPDIDPNDDEAVHQLATDITAWVMAQHARVQARIAAEKQAAEEKETKDEDNNTESP